MFTPSLSSDLSSVLFLIVAAARPFDSLPESYTEIYTTPGLHLPSVAYPLPVHLHK